MGSSRGLGDLNIQHIKTGLTADKLSFQNGLNQKVDEKLIVILTSVSPKFANER